MSIMASFHGFKCAECVQMVIASEIKGTHEPGLAITICEWCGAELQVTTDPATGEMSAVRVKRS
jgi:hypothetical protein